mmetsp:Transcript_57207/g.92668  ORF Transcript_57207/g.92668 Transcript_57207/m.92668 type:complete len:505 (+) Transcript_57207:168-1682(+)
MPASQKASVAKPQAMVLPLGESRGCRSPNVAGTSATSPTSMVSSPRAISSKENTQAKASKLVDTAVVLQLTKTKMCAFFERGKCASETCNYAHSQEELRSAPNLQKTKLCKSFLQGNCNLGQNCVYAHGDQDLRVTSGIYKTQMCHFFLRGHCKKGDRCNHAHGAVDIRPSVAAVSADDSDASPCAIGAVPTSPFGAEMTAAAAPTAHTPVKRRTPAGASFEAPPSSILKLRQSLPLADLLTGNSASVSTAAPTPTPTKSVTELAAMSISPMPSTPLWDQYSFHAATLAASMTAQVNPHGMLDPIDMLVRRSGHPGAVQGYASTGPAFDQDLLPKALFHGACDGLHQQQMQLPPLPAYPAQQLGQQWALPPQPQWPHHPMVQPHWPPQQLQPHQWQFPTQLLPPPPFQMQHLLPQMPQQPLLRMPGSLPGQSPPPGLYPNYDRVEAALTPQDQSTKVDNRYPGALEAESQKTTNDISERLASLDEVVKGLADDVKVYSRGSHRI